jgi:hypothetical protein
LVVVDFDRCDIRGDRRNEGQIIPLQRTLAAGMIELRDNCVTRRDPVIERIQLQIAAQA